MPNDEQSYKTPNVSGVKFSDTVQKWITTLNTLVSYANIVKNNKGHENDEIPEYNFGYMSVADKNYLDYLKEHIVKKDTTTSLLADSIAVSKFDVSNVRKRVKCITFSNIGGTIELNKDDDDIVIATVSGGTVNIDFNAGTDDNVNDNVNVNVNVNDDEDKDKDANKTYVEKILYIKSAEKSAENTIIHYVGNTWRFVNNGVQPNVHTDRATSLIGNEDGTSHYITKYNTNDTILLAGNSLLLKFIFIDNIALVEVLDNTQLVSNYKDAEYDET